MTKRVKFWFKGYRAVLLPVMLLSAACSQQVPDEVAAALAQAGDNRPELEKVINHYTAQGDTLKLKAAYFLIENMPEKLSYDERDLAPYDRIFHTHGDVVKQASGNGSDPVTLVEQSWQRIEAEHGRFDEMDLRRKKDLEHVKADFLIENIDLAFQAWRTRPWASQVSFKDFCEYILPYRLDREPLEDWRRKLSQRYAWVGDSLPNYRLMEDTLGVAQDVAIEAFLSVFVDTKWYKFDGAFWRHPVLGLKNLEAAGAGLCITKGMYNQFTMRSIGLATAWDYVPWWGNRDGSHGWNSIIDSKGKTFGFDAFYWPDTNWAHTMRLDLDYEKQRGKNKWAKVHRKTFSADKNALFYQNQRENPEDIPALYADVWNVDVSDLYMPTTDVSLKLDSVAGRKYAYLGVFCFDEWQPVAWGKINRDSARFEKMGRDVVYLPVAYDQGTTWPAGDCFFINDTGGVQVLKPRLKDTHALHIYESNYATQPNPCLQEGADYEILYWDRKWISLGTRKVEKDRLVLEKAPRNTLFKIRNTANDTSSRPFTYRQNRQYWF